MAADAHGDLAVPRDIEPQVAEIPDIYLYTVDDMREVIEETCVCVRQRRARQMKLSPQASRL